MKSPNERLADALKKLDVAQSHLDDALFKLQKLDQRVKDLIQANNEEVERKRLASRKLHEIRSILDRTKLN